MKTYSLFALTLSILLPVGTTFTLFHPNAELKKWIYAEDILIEHPRKSITPLTKCLLGTAAACLGYGALEGSKYFIGDTHALTNALCLATGIAVGLKTYTTCKEYIVRKKELQQIAILMKEWPEADEVRNSMPHDIKAPLDNLHETYCHDKHHYQGQAELTLKEIRAKIADHNNPFRGFFWRMLLRAFGR